MPFKSYDELIKMMEEDPDMAHNKIMRAKKGKLPIIDKENRGYGSTKGSVSAIKSNKTTSPVAKYRDRAITKRMYLARGRGETGTQPTVPSRQTKQVSSGGKSSKMPLPRERAIEKRMAAVKKRSTEDEAVSKRKKVGY